MDRCLPAQYVGFHEDVIRSMCCFEVNRLVVVEIPGNDLLADEEAIEAVSKRPDTSSS